MATEQLLGLSRNGGATFTRSQFQELSITNYHVWSAFKEELQRQKNGWWSSYFPLVNTLVEASALDFAKAEVRNAKSLIAYPAITDEYSLIGSLYVHLGSLLGGRVIHGMLERNSELLPFQPFHFYAAGATFSGGEWRLFITRLDDVLLDPGHLAIAVAQANEVFNYYQRVYLEPG